MQASRLVRRHPRAAPTDLCSAFCSLYIAARGLNTSAIHRAAGGSNNATPNPMHSAPAQTTKRGDKAAAQLQRAGTKGQSGQPGVSLNAAEQAQADQAAAKAKEALDEQKKSKEDRQKQGSLALSSLFANEAEEREAKDPEKSASLQPEKVKPDEKPLSERNYQNIEAQLNPKPDARARWMSKMVMRDVRRRGRMTREMFLARTERTHTAMSNFFKTSVKKLAPLARQIAGKSIDEAIIQMRFSKKKAAKNVLKHLVFARNEAIVARGMGLKLDEFGGAIQTKPEAASESASKAARYSVRDLIKQAINKIDNPSPPNPNAKQDAPTERASVYVEHPGDLPALPTQNADKSLKKGVAADPTDIYIAQAWVNRGKYNKKGVPRGRGRMDVHQLPFTGLSVMLKEEKTKIREQREKEEKFLRKRLDGKIWTHLPDRPVTRQSQYVLW